MTRLKRQVFLISTALAAWLRLAGVAHGAAPVENYGAQAQPRNGAVAAQPGDTVESIAKLYRLPVEDIIAYNNLQPPYKLTPRQRLLLPIPREHKVGRDDTLYSLSRMYGAAPLDIAAANHIDPRLASLRRAAVTDATTNITASTNIDDHSRAIAAASTVATAANCKAARTAAVGAGHIEPLRKNLVTRPAATAITTHTMTRVGVSSGSELLTPQVSGAAAPSGDYSLTRVTLAFTNPGVTLLTRE